MNKSLEKILKDLGIPESNASIVVEQLYSQGYPESKTLDQFLNDELLIEKDSK